MSWTLNCICTTVVVVVSMGLFGCLEFNGYMLWDGGLHDIVKEEFTHRGMMAIKTTRMRA